MRHEAAAQIVERAIPDGSYRSQWLPDQLAGDAQRVLGIEFRNRLVFEDGVAETELEEQLVDTADRYMAEKAVRLGPDVMRMAEKSLLLQVLDQQ